MADLNKTHRPLGALGVEFVVDGNIQRWGDRIRLTARLIKVEDGDTLWAGPFDEKLTRLIGAGPAILQFCDPTKRHESNLLVDQKQVTAAVPTALQIGTIYHFKSAPKNCRIAGPAPSVIPIIPI